MCLISIPIDVFFLDVFWWIFGSEMLLVIICFSVGTLTTAFVLDMLFLLFQGAGKLCMLHEAFRELEHKLKGPGN